jgi:hypothetical protein
MRRSFTIITALTTLAMSLISTSASAQSTSVFANGLLAPARIIITPGGNLLVTESGNGPNTGRVSILDRTGTRRTLIDGLPSAINTAEGDPGPSGPSGIDIRGRTVYVAIGQGDALLAGPIPGTLLPNPSPSSTLFSSVLAIRLNTPVAETAGGFSLALANQADLKTGAEVRLTNSSGERATLEVVADFGNFTYEFNPAFPNNVRASNPFGVAVNGQKLFVADAAQNLVWEVDLTTGEARVMTTFARKPNPLPFGPPFVDAVPDNVRLFGKQLLVTYLTGFPFAAGQAEVRKVNRVNNSQSAFIGGLTSALDVLPVKGASGQDRFFVVEISTNLLMGAPGRLLLFETPSSAPTVLSSNLIGPTSVAYDAETGSVYVTQLFTGQVIRLQAPQ